MISSISRKSSAPPGAILDRGMMGYGELPVPKHGWALGADWSLDKWDVGTDEEGMRRSHPHEPLYSNFPWFSCMARSENAQEKCSTTPTENVDLIKVTDISDVCSWNRLPPSTAHAPPSAGHMVQPRLPLDMRQQLLFNNNPAHSLRELDRTSVTSPESSVSTRPAQ